MSDQVMPEPGARTPASAVEVAGGLPGIPALRLRVERHGGEARVWPALSTAHEGHRGVVHGGIIAFLIDEAMGHAALSVDPHRYMVTANLSIEYLHAVTSTQDLTVHAWLARDRRLLADAHCEVRLSDGTVTARGRALLAMKRG